MAAGLIEKLTNFFMPVEEADYAEDHGRAKESKDMLVDSERRAGMRLHTVGVVPFKVFVHAPESFDDVKSYADYLRVGVVVIVNYQQVDILVQQKMSDFLNGVCYIMDGAVQRISEQVTVYVPTGATVDKELCAFAVPTYSKKTR
ncbi:MAG TPA: cell division protein SepF [Patescibacteria group bacterium]|nr:cell division protein SepF [Patescibacteria group bacterium]